MTATHEHEQAVEGIAGFSTDCERCGGRILMVRTVEDRVARYYGDKPPTHSHIALDPEPDERFGCVAIDVMGYAQPLRIGHPLHLGRLRQPHIETCDGSLAKPSTSVDRRDLE